MAITIKCTKCGNENQLGDLFCRQCGNELDLNILDPGEVRVVKKHKGARNLTELLFIAIVFAFFALVVCLFLAPSGVSFPTKDDDVYTKRIDNAAGAVSNSAGDATRVVKQDDAGGVFQRLIIKDDGTNAVIKVNGGTVEFTLRKMYYGLPLTFSICGKLEDGETSDEYHYRLAKNTVFSVTDTKVGMIPATKLTFAHIRRYFLDFLGKDEFKSLPDKIESIKLTPENDFSVTLLKK